MSDGDAKRRTFQPPPKPLATREGPPVQRGRGAGRQQQERGRARAVGGHMQSSNPYSMRYM
eukprot:scaffold840_cov350-Prasinococcus_capsulatus_cf.AAC.1